MNISVGSHVENLKNESDLLENQKRRKNEANEMDRSLRETCLLHIKSLLCNEISILLPFLLY